MLKGQLFEQDVASVLHQKYIPVLISSQLLRRYGCGQIDIAFWNCGVLYLIEVKYTARISFEQKYRIRRSANLLSELLQVPVKIQLVKKALPNGMRFFTLIL